MVPSPRFELGMLVRLFLRQVCLPFHQEGETVVNCVVPQARFERAIATVFKAAVSTDSTIGALTILCGASPRIRTERNLLFENSASADCASDAVMVGDAWRDRTADGRIDNPVLCR